MVTIQIHRAFFEVALFASCDKVIRNLSVVHLEISKDSFGAWHAHATATNGHHLCSVSWPVFDYDGGELSLSYELGSIEAAAKLFKRKDSVALNTETNELRGAQHSFALTPSDTRFPNWRLVVADDAAPKDTVSFGINPLYVADFAMFLKRSGFDCSKGVPVTHHSSMVTASAACIDPQSIPLSVTYLLMLCRI